MIRFRVKLASVFFALTMTGCAKFESATTKHSEDACKILTENKDWKKATYRAWRKWGIPISVQLSVIKHESSFNGNAAAQTSTAYGYAQALEGTFSDYKKHTKNYSANRSSFYDSTDFVGWYFSNTIKRIGHNPADAETFYLAYHDGIGGYKKRTYKEKKWLVEKAEDVQKLAEKYKIQINKCRIKF